MKQTAISFSRKSQIFHPRVFNAPDERVPLGIVYRRTGSKKLEWWTTGQRKKFDDFFARLQGERTCGSQTDERTDTGRQQRPRLRKASHGKISGGRFRNTLCLRRIVTCRKYLHDYDDGQCADGRRMSEDDRGWAINLMSRLEAKCSAQVRNKMGKYR